MKTKLVIFAFGILAVLPLIRNIYLLSKVVVVVPPQQSQSQLSLLSSAASASLSLNDDESIKTQQQLLPPSEQQQQQSPTLDFAIIGFAILFFIGLILIVEKETETLGAALIFGALAVLAIGFVYGWRKQINEIEIEHGGFTGDNE